MLVMATTCSPPPLTVSRGQCDAGTVDESKIVATQMPDHASYCNRATKGQIAHRNGHNREIVQAKKGGQLELITRQLVQKYVIDKL